MEIENDYNDMVIKCEGDVSEITYEHSIYSTDVINVEFVY